MQCDGQGWTKASAIATIRCIAMGVFDSSNPNVSKMEAAQDLEGLRTALRHPKDRNIRKEAALASVRPGVRASEIDRRARGLLEERGLGEHFGHGLGHGVGLSVHERPAITRRSAEVVREGMVFTVEPGVYIPGWGGIRIEDTVLVTAGGCEVLTPAPKSLESCLLEW